MPARTCSHTCRAEFLLENVSYDECDLKYEFLDFGYCASALRSPANPVPRVRFSFSQHQEHGLWPLPIYAQSEWRSIFVTVDNHCCFKAGSPWFAGTSCLGSGQSPCSCCWPKEMWTLGTRLQPCVLNSSRQVGLRRLNIENSQRQVRVCQKAFTFCRLL